MAEHILSIHQRQANEIASRTALVQKAQADLSLYLTGIVQGADADLSAMTGYRVTSENGVFQLRVTLPDPPAKKGRRR